MTDRPVLFTEPMVQAILAGRKTQQRFILEGAPHEPEWVVLPNMENWWTFRNDEDDEWRKCEPRYRMGDRLWVRETFSGPYADREILPSQWGAGTPIWYWADGNPEDGDWTKPRPSVHMPRWASRLTLEVVDVRIQRLNDISDADCAAEGIYECDGLFGPRGDWMWAPDAGTAYCALFECENGAGTWDCNPWVTALTFNVLRKNIDA